MLHPKIDKRNKDDVIKQMNDIVPYYTPEWRFNLEDPDPGSALALIFADLFIENVNRLNRVPLKHYIAYLNLLGISRNIPQPATTYTTFYLSFGAQEPVLIPKGTKVAASKEDEEIIFETENPLFVTPAQVTNMFKVCHDRDIIQEVPDVIYKDDDTDNDEQNYPMYTFDENENLQEHSLYISHRDMFNVRSTVKIEVVLTHPMKKYLEKEMATLLGNPDEVEWSYYSDGTWQQFDYVEVSGNRVILHKTKVQKLDEMEIETTEGKWIKCSIKTIKREDESRRYNEIEIGQLHVKTDYYDVDGTGGFFPDLLFNDDLHLPIEENGGFYPFGQFFAPYSTFYICSEEAFSKKGSNVFLSFTLKLRKNKMQTQMQEEIEWKLIMKESEIIKDSSQHISILNVVWEYWNGQAWVTLPIDKEYEEVFRNLSDDEIDVTIQFQCPFDLEETFVNSIENYWIRARVLTIDPIYSAEVYYNTPWIENLRLSYKSENHVERIEECIAYNNLQYENKIHDIKTEGNVIRPFTVIDFTSPAIYIGFDEQPRGGPISMYLAFADQTFTERERPFIEWEYLRNERGKKEWAPLKVIDDTDSFTKNGECRFIGPDDFAKTSLFAKNRYWIRLLNRKATIEDGQLIRTPKLKKVYLNTTKVIQQDEIIGEHPTERTGEDENTFQLINFPVLSEEVWVDENNYISEEQIEKISKQSPEKINIIRDSEQNIQRCLVKWENVSHFLHSNSDDRHYMIDRSTGIIQFGDGVKGKKIPNLGSDSIIVHYKIGGGTKGNVDRYEINQLQSAIPFIERVSNPEPAGGGSNLEEMDDVLHRGPMIVKHQNRAVTAEDFEWLVREASQSIAKVKCLSNYNSRLEKEIGAVTIVIFPENGVKGMHIFPELKRKVEAYLLERAASTVAFPEKIQVIKPALLEISLNVTLIVEDMNVLVETELETLRRINEFLDPLTGNSDGKGWAIGEKVHHSIFYSFLKSIRHVKYVDKLYMTAVKIENGERTEIILDENTHIPHGIVMNGKHKVQVKV